MRNVVLAKCLLIKCYITFTDKTKIELFGKNQGRGGGNIMIWACFAASGPSHFEVIRGKIISVCHKSTTERLQKNKIHYLEWLSQSPYVNLIEILWDDLKRDIQDFFLCHSRH
uniref:Tc1-like transposase DDE domain-containing protein n=1 Tax=Anabas testudineus TaxID=64144 RepID=A0A3Q1J2R4_ANATE